MFVFIIFFSRVTLFEDPAYQSLVEKIIANRRSLQKEFEKADRNGTCIQFIRILILYMIFFV